MKTLAPLFLMLVPALVQGQEKYLFEKSTPAWVLPWDADWVTAVALAGPKRTLFAGNREGQILGWELPEKAASPLPAPSRRLDGHTNQITQLVATPDGRWLVSASYDRTLRLWDLQTPAKNKGEVVLKTGTKKKGKEAGDSFPVATFEANQVISAHGEWIRTMAMTPDGKRLISGDDKGLLLVFDMLQRKEVKRLQVPGWIQAVAISADGQNALVCEATPRRGNLPNAVTWFDLETGKGKSLAEGLKAEKGSQGVPAFGAAAISLDAKQVAVGIAGEVDTNGGKIFLVDLATGKKTKELPGHLYGITALAYHADGQHLLSAGRDTVVKVWRLSDGKMVAELGKSRGGQFRDWMHAFSISVDGQWIAGADMAGQIPIWWVPK